MQINDTPVDTLTVKFWLDTPGPDYRGPAVTAWACHIGPDMVTGVGGFGATPLQALRDLCENVARDEGHRTDGGKLLLR